MRSGRLGLLFALLMSWSCKGGNLNDLPMNDPVQALYCNQGFIYVPANAGCIPAQTAIVHGLVTDSATGLPLPNMLVTVYPIGQLSQDANGVPIVVNPNAYVPLKTDANGYFSVNGLLTTYNIIVTYQSTDHYYRSNSFSTTSMGPGALVVNASVTLQPLPAQFKIAGVIYAGDGPATNATVQIIDSGSNIRFTATTDNNGRYSFTVWDAVSYLLRVMPYDKDGDGVADYTLSTVNLGVPSSAGATVNLQNYVLNLTPISKSIVFSNLVPFPGAIGAPNAGRSLVYTGLRIGSPSSPILVQFSASVITSSVTAYVRAWEINNGTYVYGANLPATLTWSSDHTLLTITPAAPFVADSDLNTGYQLMIKSAIWNDGSIYINDSDSKSFVAFNFDVGTATPSLSSPTPQLYFSNRTDAFQTSTKLSCDAQVCWAFDSVNYFYEGYQTPSVFNAAPQYFNQASGLEMTWPAVAGAKSYNVYVRQRNNNIFGHDFGNWYNVSATFSSSPIDPSLGSLVYATNILSSGYPAWSSLGDASIGALSLGNKLDFAVTAVDYNGFESPLDTTKAFTLSDVTYASIDWASGDTGGSGAAQQSTTELGTAGIKKVFSLTFSEAMNGTGTPSITPVGGNIMGISTATPLLSWNADALRPENTSSAAVLGPVTMAVRGACVPLTCSVSSQLPDQRACVSSVAPLSGANGNKIFFVDAFGNVQNTGASTQTWVTVSGVNTTTNVLSFSPGAQATMSTGSFIFACPAYSIAGSVATLAQATTTTSAVIHVDNASIFYPNETVNLFDTSTSTLFHSQVVLVDTSANTVTLSSATSVVMSGTTTFMSAAPQDFEYGYRPVTVPTLSEDTTVSATTTLSFDNSIKATTVMVGDAVLIDVDGNLNTANDRFFATVAGVKLNSVGTTPGVITLGAAPTGLPSLPSGTTLVHSTSLVMLLGDSFAVGGSLADTSGNLGLNSYRDHFSPCSGTPGCVNNSFVY